VPIQRRLIHSIGKDFYLRKLHSWLFCWHRYGIRNPVRTLLPFLLLAGVSFSQLPNLQYTLSPDDMKEDAFPSVERTRDLRQSFDERASAVLILSKSTPFNMGELCRIREFFNDQKATNSHLVKSQSTFDLRRPQLFPSDLFPGKMTVLGYPRLLKLNCDSSLTDIPDFSNLEKSPWSFLFSGPKKEITLIFTFEDAKSFKYGSFDPSMLESLKNRFKRDLVPQIPGLQAKWLGTAESMSETLSGMNSSNGINIAFSLLIILASRLVLGTWISGFLLVASLIITTMITFGLKALFGSPVDALSDSLFLMIGVASLEDFIFLSYFMRLKGMHWRRASRRLLLPSFLTSFTTIVGFSSLKVSNLLTIRELGHWAAIGSGFEWIFVGILFPAFLSFLYKKKPVNWVNPARAPLMSVFEKLSIRTIHRKFALAALLIIPTAAFLAPYLETNESLIALFPKNNELRQSIESIQRDRNWFGSMSVVFEPGQSDEEILKSIAELRKIPGITEVESGLIALDFFQRQIPSAYHSLVRNEIRYSENYKTYRDHLGRERVNLYVNPLMLNELKSIVDQVNLYCEANRCFSAGSLVKQVELSYEIPRTLIESMVVTLIIVGFALFWICAGTGQIRLTLWVILSSFWGPLLMLLAVVLLRIPMNFLTSIFASVLLGIAGDNAIQFLMLEKNRGVNGNSASRGIDLLGGGAMFCFTVMAVSSLLLMGSSFAPPRVFGLLLFFGLLSCLVGDVWVLRALLPASQASQASQASKEERNGI